jgi:hypothetical protein
MTSKAASDSQKDPNDWVSGDEPMTGAQASYLKTLCEQAHIRRLSTKASRKPRLRNLLTRCASRQG